MRDFEYNLRIPGQPPLTFRGYTGILALILSGLFFLFVVRIVFHCILPLAWHLLTALFWPVILLAAVWFAWKVFSKRTM